MGRVTVDAVRDTGELIVLEFDVQRDTVECWAERSCYAVFDRRALRAWLHAPAGYYIRDDVTWSRAATGVAVSFEPLVRWWVLTPEDLGRLRARL
jgi:hypothetical protein